MPVATTPKRFVPLITRFQRLIGLEQNQADGGKTWPWLAIAIFYALACALLALRQALGSEFTLADDVREHVFWMFRFVDPRLFPSDPIADYFQSLAPPGYAYLYWLLARAGINPLLASKLIPTALSLIAARYFFGLARGFFRSAAVAAFSTIVFTQSLWLNSDLSSATPRAFFYPLFTAFLYYQQRDSFAGIFLSITVAALFFPPTALLSLAVLGFACLRWKKGGQSVQLRGYRDYKLFAAALLVAFVCLVPYLVQTAAFGPLVTFAQAKRMSEFGPKGRVPIFLSSWWGYWVAGNVGVHAPPTRPPWILAVYLWPLLRRFPNEFPLLKSIVRGARPVPLIVAASLSLFLIAHLLLFRLYLPNRYTASVTRLLLSLLGGGAMLALMDAALRRVATNPAMQTRSRQKVIIAAFTLLLGIVLFYPLLLPEFPTASYIRGVDPDLYRFVARQPVTARIASLSEEADNLPTFSHRSVVVGAECAVPFHPGYYLPLRDRGLQIARAQYATDPAAVQNVVRDQQIDLWLLDADAFGDQYWHKSRLLRQLRLAFPAENLGLSHGAAPFLQRPPPESIAYRDRRFILVDTHRLFQRRPPSATLFGSSILNAPLARNPPALLPATINALWKPAFAGRSGSRRRSPPAAPTRQCNG